MPTHLGFTIWMEVEGTKLEEFRTELDEASSTVTCWIPCQSGKDWTECTRPASHAQLYPGVQDGWNGRRVELIRRNMIRKNDLELEPRYYEGQYEEGTGVLRPFQFAPLKHTDDDTYLESFKDGLGDIIVSIYTFEELVRDRGRHSDRSEAVKPLEGAVAHERAKQRLASCIAFGQPRLSPGESPLQDVETRDPRKGRAYAGAKRVGMVVFKYRDMDILIAEGIAPRPAAPPKALTPVAEQGSNDSGRLRTRSTSRNASSSIPAVAPLSIIKKEDEDEEDGGDSDVSGSDDELRELKARAAALEELCNLKARIAELEWKKRTRKEGAVPCETKRVKKVKKEHKNDSPFVPGEVIDLT